MKINGYINIQSWMVTELNLKGNELLIYAIIHGFSQDGQGIFNGSIQYLAEWTNSTKQGVIKNLKSLQEKGLVEKVGVDEVGKNLYITKREVNKVYNSTEFTVGGPQSLLGS